MEDKSLVYIISVIAIVAMVALVILLKTQKDNLTNNPDVYGQATLGTTQITSLVGEGNAYACLTSTGILYRSNTPCR